ncbi:unnamed protein product [Haemonchus placei]|uniref:Fimbrial biogenesis outer membrane usher protein n=1 Tax=Haemonchus placei TaxID=6290 RepID=A0A0N4WLE7_HAEPC|nr:unnamed protein product [Haemonchus placei]
MDQGPCAGFTNHIRDEPLGGACVGVGGAQQDVFRVQKFPLISQRSLLSLDGSLSGVIVPIDGHAYAGSQVLVDYRYHASASSSEMSCESDDGIQRGY